MPDKEMIELGEDDKAIVDFLERVRVSGPRKVRIGQDVFTVSVSPDTLSQSARDFLVSGLKTSNQ